MDAIRAATADKAAPPPEAGAVKCSLSTFRLLTETEVRALIMTSPIKSCALDPVPTFLLREFVDLLLPCRTIDMANYRPISNVTFVSKIIQRAVAKQLHQYLTDNELLPRYQSAYRRHHSTETAMLRVLSDAFTVADANQVTLLGLLDLSAAFDCVDHQLLLQRLRRDFGFSDTVLGWITSFVTCRSQQVACKGQLSTVSRFRSWTCTVRYVYC